MSSILWFVGGMAFGYYFPEIVSKLRTSVLDWFDKESETNSEK